MKRKVIRETCNYETKNHCVVLKYYLLNRRD